MHQLQLDISADAVSDIPKELRRPLRHAFGQTRVSSNGRRVVIDCQGFTWVYSSEIPPGWMAGTNPTTAVRAGWVPGPPPFPEDFHPGKDSWKPLHLHLDPGVPFEWCLGGVLARGQGWSIRPSEGEPAYRASDPAALLARDFCRNGRVEQSPDHLGIWLRKPGEILLIKPVSIRDSTPCDPGTHCGILPLPHGLSGPVIVSFEHSKARLCCSAITHTSSLDRPVCHFRMALIPSQSLKELGNSLQVTSGRGFLSLSADGRAIII